MRRDSQSSNELIGSKPSQVALIANEENNQNNFSINLNQNSKNYNLDRFRTKSSILDKAKKKLTSKSKLFCKNMRKKSFYKNQIYTHLPIFKWLPRYKFKNFMFTDIMCGLTIGIMNIPQGLAYALLASLNPITGLYVSFFPVLVYAIFGSSRHLVISAVAIVSLLTGETVNRVVHEYGSTILPANVTDPEQYKKLEEKLKLDVATDLSLLVGAFQILFGLFGLGGLTSFFSDTFISGYTCGSAVHVVVSQTKDLFGLKNLTRFEGNFKIPKSIYQLATRIPSSNLVTTVGSFGCIIFLTIFKEALNPAIKKYLRVEFPSELLLLIAMTSISYGFDLNQNYNVTILQKIPTGFPTPSLNPNLSLIHFIIKDAFLIAVIAISVSMSLAALFSRRNSYKIDPHQELYAFGLTNLVGSVFSCFPTAASLSRSSLLESMGGHSQLASVCSSLIILVVIIWLAPLFKTLPTLCLASIIIVALKNMIFQVKDFFKLMKINRYEAITWLMTFLGTVVLDVDVGLFVGVGTSILVVVIRDMFSPIRPMVKYKNTSSYVEDELVYSEANDQEETSFKNPNFQSNICIYKIKHSIYFANCHAFQDHLYNTYGFRPEKKSLVDKNNSINNANSLANDMDQQKCCYQDIILDFSSVNYVDTNGIQVIRQIIDDYKSFDILVLICGAQESFIQILVNLNIWSKYEPHLFVTIEEAICFSNQKNSPKKFF